LLYKLLLIVTFPLIVVHFMILYFWIFDWQKLATELGLTSWISSMVLGVFFYLLYRRNGKLKSKTFSIFRKMLFSSTLMTVILSLLAIAIEAIINSMP
jgi:peptidoglycan biosynthesis protein MviN/MurJ (putative lipid II flippase)